MKELERSVAATVAAAKRKGAENYKQLELSRAKLSDKNLPEDLAMPEPADMFDRVGAASIDLSVAAVGGAAAAACMHVVGMPWEVYVHGSVAAGTILFALRDVLWEEGTRSLGKSAMGLEVAVWDGRLVTHWQSMVRNIPVLVLPLWDIHPWASTVVFMLLAFDSASVVATPDRRRIGDYLAACVCVRARPGREYRVMDLVEREELGAVEDAVAAIDKAALQRIQEGHEDDPVPLSAIAEAGGDAARMADSKLLRRKARRASGPSVVLPGMMAARRRGELGETKRRVQAIARSLDPNAPPPPPPPDAEAPRQLPGKTT